MCKRLKKLKKKKVKIWVPKEKKTEKGDADKLLVKMESTAAE